MTTIDPDRPEPVQPREFENMNAFHLDDFARYSSGEADYGVHWHWRGSRWPQWRVSYVQATGEVYATELVERSRARVVILGVVTPDPPPALADARRGEPHPWSAGHVYYRTLERLLGNWADPAVSNGFSLEWLRDRLAHTMSGYQ